jgi:hypothetical protein
LLISLATCSPSVCTRGSSRLGRCSSWHAGSPFGALRRRGSSTRDGTPETLVAATRGRPAARRWPCLHGTARRSGRFTQDRYTAGEAASRTWRAVPRGRQATQTEGAKRQGGLRPVLKRCGLFQAAGLGPRGPRLISASSSADPTPPTFPAIAKSESTNTEHQAQPARPTWPPAPSRATAARVPGR